MHLSLVCRWISLLVCCSMSCGEVFANAGDTGVEGVISVSPTHGGPVRADERSTAPLRETEFVVRKGDEKVASFTTGTDGKFRVVLPPGHYTVSRAKGKPRVGSDAQFEVDVVPGQMTKVEWTCDSGLR